MKLRVSLISLECDRIRRERLSNQLENFHINYQIIDAINGKELKAIDYFHKMKCENSKFNGRKYLTPSELGCFLSHKKAIEDFLNSMDDILLVIEDDITLINYNLIEDVNYNKDFILNSMDIFILGGQDGLKSFKKVMLKKNSKSKDFRKVCMFTHRFIYRTCCYMINRKVAAQILRLMNMTSYFVDDWNLILKNTRVQNLYYTNWFSHPIDISNSTIEEERRLV
ncbi:TPA: glycosyltransferase family 25 protein [Photobacterium damselae]